MNKQKAPVFRKSMSGYNKKDVNAYILDLNRMYNDAEKEHRAALASVNSEIERYKTEATVQYLKHSGELAEKNGVIETLSGELDEAKLNILELERVVTDKDAEIESLKAELDIVKKSGSAEKNIADSFGGITDESEKALLFDCISAKTGEIMLIACKTADDIVAKAKAEAAAIINEANTKKDTMLKDISGSADTVASDISSYIKNAVDGCIDRIYTSIKTIDNK